jgi:hypothetical protein
MEMASLLPRFKKEKDEGATGSQQLSMWWERGPHTGECMSIENKQLRMCLPYAIALHNSDLHRVVRFDSSKGCLDASFLWCLLVKCS